MLLSNRSIMMCVDDNALIVLAPPDFCADYGDKALLVIV